MARRIYAGADLFVMPSRFEPSGQGQMIALRYGTPPIVRRTGGLADSVVDVGERSERGTGFVFGPPRPTRWSRPAVRAMAFRGDGRAARAGGSSSRRDMALDFSWESGPAPRYLDAYRRAIALRGRGRRLTRAAGRRPPLSSAPTRKRRRHEWPRAPEDRMAKQFVVQLPNRPGALAELSETLAARGVDLRAIGGGGIGDVGHVILTTADDPDDQGGPRRGRATPTSRASRSSPRWTIGRAAWRGIARALADAGVNIYGHLFLGRWGDRAMFTFVVDKPEIARPILERKS